MFRYKPFPIAAILAVFLLISFVNSSYAPETFFPVIHEPIEIEVLRSYNDISTEYNHGIPYFTFYIKTNRPFFMILWYVDDAYEGISMGNGDKTEDYFGFSNLPGNIKGKEYEIKAVVWPPEPFNMQTASETYDFTVVRPIIVEGNGPRTGVRGHAEVTRFYFNGSTVVMDASAYAYNRTAREVNVHAWFRTKKYTGKNGDEIRPEQRDTKPLEKNVKSGKRSKYYTPDSSVVDRQIGGLIGDEKYYFDAHTHLQVTAHIGGIARVDDWEADTRADAGEIIEFSKTDNPE